MSIITDSGLFEKKIFYFAFSKNANCVPPKRDSFVSKADARQV